LKVDSLVKDASMMKPVFTEAFYI